MSQRADNWILRLAFGLSAVALAGCSGSSDPAPLGLCPVEVVRVEVYNYFRDHEVADYQALSELEQIAGYCETVWNHLAVESHRIDESELDQRSTTVLEMQLADQTRRTVWVHRLSGFRASSVIVFDTGESFLLGNQSIPPYYAPSSEVIDRSAVPMR